MIHRKDASLSRRAFLGDSARAGVAAMGMASLGYWASRNTAWAAHHRKMTISLYPGSIGVRANQRETVELAAKHGFESVQAMGGELAAMSYAQFEEFAGWMRSKGVVFGGSGLPVDFRRDDDTFRNDLKQLPKVAVAIQRAGLRRMSTWLSPSSDELTYMQNFRQTARRLRQVCQVLADHDIRFGLEYVGTQTLLVGRKYPFIHTFAETRDLIEAMRVDNCGLVLDSWHWWTAGDTVDDIKTLSNNEVALVDLNDAPLDVPKSEVRDNRRELPAATGRIEIAAFLDAIHSIGYDGPVRAEPFNQALNAMDDDEACATTIRAMKKAFAQSSMGG